jgi:hypothetical protein
VSPGSGFFRIYFCDRLTRRIGGSYQDTGTSAWVLRGGCFIRDLGVHYYIREEKDADCSTGLGTIDLEHSTRKEDK